MGIKVPTIHTQIEYYFCNHHPEGKIYHLGFNLWRKKGLSILIKKVYGWLINLSSVRQKRTGSSVPMCQGTKSWEWEGEKLKGSFELSPFTRRKVTVMCSLGTQMKMFDLFLARKRNTTSG